MALNPSDEAVVFVLSLDLTRAQTVWNDICNWHGIEEFYPNSLGGMYLCKTEFDRNQSHAVRIWKLFMAEYIVRRIT